MCLLWLKLLNKWNIYFLTFFLTLKGIFELSVTMNTLCRPRRDSRYMCILKWLLSIRYLLRLIVTDRAWKIWIHVQLDLETSSSNILLALASLLFYWFSWQMICLVPCPLRMKSYLPKGKNLHVLVLDNWTGLFLSHVHICTCPIQNTADTHKCPYLKKQLLLSLCQHYGTFCGLKWRIWLAKMFFSLLKFKLVQFVNFAFFIIVL